MTSKSFSKAKRLRAKTKSVQKCIRHIKQSRLRHHRRSVKQLLKLTHSIDSLLQHTLVNDGSWKIV